MPTPGAKILGQPRKKFDYKLSNARLPGEKPAAPVPIIAQERAPPEELYFEGPHGPGQPGGPAQHPPLQYAPGETSATYFEAPYAQWIPGAPAVVATAGAGRHPPPAAASPLGPDPRRVTLRGVSPANDPAAAGGRARSPAPRFAARPRSPAAANGAPVPYGVASAPEGEASALVRVGSPAAQAGSPNWAGGDGFHVSTLTLNRSLNLDSYVPGRSIAKIKLRILAKWIDSLNVCPPITDLCIRMRTGNLLCTILERLQPGLELKGVNRKPVIAESCIHNIEIGLQNLFRRSIQYQNMPSAREIFEARPGAVLRLLGEVFDVFVVQPARTQLRALLAWCFSTVARYGILGPGVAEAVPPGPAAAALLRDTLASGTAWCCLVHAHAADAGFDLGLVFRQPAALEEVLNNLEYAGEFCEQLGIPWYWWSPTDTAAFPADDVILAQLHALHSYFRSQGKLAAEPPLAPARVRFADTDRILAAQAEAERRWADERAADVAELLQQRAVREAEGRQRKQLAYYAELAERERQMDERCRLSPFLQARRMQRMKERLETERVLRRRSTAAAAAVAERARWGGRPCKPPSGPAGATAGSAKEASAKEAAPGEGEWPGRLWPRLIRRIEAERDVEWVPVDVKASVKATRAARAAAQGGGPLPDTAARARPAAPAPAPGPLHGSPGAGHRGPPPAPRPTPVGSASRSRPSSAGATPAPSHWAAPRPAARPAERPAPADPPAARGPPPLARAPSGKSTPRESPRTVPRAPEEEEEDAGQLQSYLSTIPSSLTGRPGARQPAPADDGGYEFDEEQTTDNPMYSEGLRTVAEESAPSEGRAVGGLSPVPVDADGDPTFANDDAATGYSGRHEDGDPFGEEDGGVQDNFSPGWQGQAGAGGQAGRRGWEREVDELFGEEEEAEAGRPSGSPTAVGPGSLAASSPGSPHRAPLPSPGPAPPPARGPGFSAPPTPVGGSLHGSAAGTPRARQAGLPPPPVPVAAARGPSPAEHFVEDPVPVRPADFTWGTLDLEQFLSYQMPRILEPRGWSRGEWEGASVHLRSTLFEPKLYHLIPPEHPGEEEAEPAMHVFQVEMDVPEAYGPALVWRDLDTAELLGAVELLHVVAVEREFTGTTVTIRVAPPGGQPASVQFMTGEYEERDGYTWAAMLFCFLLKALHRTPLRLTEDDMDWIRSKAEMTAL